jgi:DNA-binding GntR family transcriptional regulator
MTMADTGMLVQRVVAPVRRQVYEQFRRAIVDGRFEDGQRLTERQLAEMTGVSRPTIREALQQLVAEGLVTTIPGKGWVVASLTREEARDLYAVRAILEGLAARRFAERATDDEVADLLKSCTLIEATLGTGRDVTEMMEAKSGFYAVLFAGAHSEIVVSLLTALHARISFMRARTLAQPGRPEETIAEIRRIADFIAARDAAGAEAESTAHVRSAATRIFALDAGPGE